MINKNALVVAAHPDDELLGVGGTIALHAAAGDQVTCVVAVAGALKHDSDGQKRVHAQAERAADVLGVHKLMLLDFPC